jgi:hypothetical protein
MVKGARTPVVQVVFYTEIVEEAVGVRLAPHWQEQLVIPGCSMGNVLSHMVLRSRESILPETRWTSIWIEVKNIANDE